MARNNQQTLRDELSTHRCKIVNSNTLLDRLVQDFLKALTDTSSLKLLVEYSDTNRLQTYRDITFYLWGMLDALRQVEGSNYNNEIKQILELDMELHELFENCRI